MRLVRTFRIRPDKYQPHYYKIFIFRDRETMHRFWAEQLKRLPEKEAASHGYDPEMEAQASWWGTGHQKRAARKGVREVGQVIFHFDRLGAGIVAHEMTHAGLYFAQACRIKLDDYRARSFGRHDEFLARIVSELVRKFWLHYYRLFPKERWR